MTSRILIVEDDPSIRLGLKRSLEFEGFTIELAKDGEEAIQRAFDKKPNLIVLDLMLPKVNGFEVCRTVRKYDSTIPIVILSAKGDEGDKVLGLELGADDYNTKPFSIRELTARIKAALRRRKAMEGEVESFEEHSIERLLAIGNHLDHELFVEQMVGCPGTMIELLICGLVADGQFTPGNQQRLCVPAQGHVLGPAIDPAFLVAPIPFVHHLG